MSKHKFLQNLEEKLLHPEPDLSYLFAEEQFERIMAKVSDLPEPVISSDDLLERLRVSKKSGKPLRIKFGIDPTAPEIHIGHAVSLINLRLFQRMGHKIILLIGDFTGMVGDPSGRMTDRAALTQEDVRRNMSTYEEQASRVIDLKDPTIERRYNNEWMSQLTMQKWVEILMSVSANELLQRKDFKARLEAGSGLSMAELEYALFMAYDSVILNPDIELGGIDQYLNLHMCRQMMADAGQKPEVMITYNLLSGTTGAQDDQERFIKMSKSMGNHIPVTTDPPDMYGKVMSIPDEIMWSWYRELTEITTEELQKLKGLVDKGDLHPKETKQLLARVIIGVFNHFSPQIIEEAESDFNAKFGKQAVLVPDSTSVIQMNPDETLIETLSRVTEKSKSDLRRLIQQKGICILQGEEYIPITMEDLISASEQLDGQVVRIGKRQYYRLNQ